MRLTASPLHLGASAAALLLTLPSTRAFTAVPRFAVAKPAAAFAPPAASSASPSHLHYANKNDAEGGNHDGGSEEGEFLPLDYFSQSVSTLLQQRMRQVEQTEQQNWKDGNCEVRGFSLDPNPPTDEGSSSSSSKIRISSLCQPANEDNVLVVGRTDGSVCIVQLGTELFARFTQQLKLKTVATSEEDGLLDEIGETLSQEESSSSSSSSAFPMAATFQLDRQASSLESMESGAGSFVRPGDEGATSSQDSADGIAADDMLTDDLPKPFTMMAQFATGRKAPISNMVVVQEGTSIDEEATLFVTIPASAAVSDADDDGMASAETVAEEQSTIIQQWRLDDLFNADEGEAASVPTLANTIDLSMVHSQDAVDLQVMALPSTNQQVLVTVSSKGMISVWDAETAEVMAFGQIPSVLPEDEDNKAMDGLLTSQPGSAGTAASVHPTITSMAVPNKEVVKAGMTKGEDSSAASLVYFGTSTGHVLVYDIMNDILTSCGDDIAAEPTMLPPPSLTFSATNHQEQIAVTALAHAGRGTLNSKKSSSAVTQTSIQNAHAIIVGLSNGSILHFEVLEQIKNPMDDTLYQEDTTGSDDVISEGHAAVEYHVWPKLASQKFPNRKVHVLRHAPPVADASTDAVWKLQYLSHAHFILATTPTSLSILNGCTGVKYYDVSDLKFDAPNASSMVVTPYHIITNGQDEMVCIHDFDSLPPLWQDETNQRMNNQSYLDSLESSSASSPPNSKDRGDDTYVDYAEDATD